MYIFGTLCLFYPFYCDNVGTSGINLKYKSKHFRFQYISLQRIDYCRSFTIYINE